LIFFESSIMQTPAKASKIGESDRARGRRVIWHLSLIGLAPLAILAILLILIERNNTIYPLLIDGFKTVSAISLSFMGGVRWGVSLRARQFRPIILAGSLLPAIIGWATLLLAGPIAIGILLLATCGMGAWDSFAWHNKIGLRWYVQTRTIVTLLAAAIHIIALLSVL
jgi:hypothetical protein